MTRYELNSQDGPFVVEVVPADDGHRVTVSGKEYLVKLKRQPGQNTVVAEFGDRPIAITIIHADPLQVQFSIGGERLSYTRSIALPEPASTIPAPVQARKDVVVAPMPGKVIQVLTKGGEAIRAGDPLVVLESMKMEVAVRADRDGVVEEVLVKEGAAVRRGEPLIRLG